MVLFILRLVMTIHVGDFVKPQNKLRSINLGIRVVHHNRRSRATLDVIIYSLSRQIRATNTISLVFLITSISHRASSFTLWFKPLTTFFSSLTIVWFCLSSFSIINFRRWSIIKHASQPPTPPPPQCLFSLWS